MTDAPPPAQPPAPPAGDPAADLTVDDILAELSPGLRVEWEIATQRAVNRKLRRAFADAVNAMHVSLADAAPTT